MKYISPLATDGPGGMAKQAAREGGVKARIIRSDGATIRYERVVAMHRAFLHRGGALIIFNFPERS